MKQRLLSCIAILCLLMTLPAISGAKDMVAFSELRMVVNEAQQKNLNRMRAQAEYDAIHNTNRQNYIARSWTSSDGDVYTMQFNKDPKPLCELVYFSDEYGNIIHLSFEELPYYCVTYILWIEDAVTKETTTNLSFQLCWPSYYIWNQVFEWDDELDTEGYIPIEFRNFECVSPDELMNSTKWCKTFVESYGVGGSYNSDKNNWQYFTMLPNSILGFESMANGEMGYTTISDQYASTIEFNYLEEPSHTVSLNQDLYFKSHEGENYTMSNSPHGTARIEGFAPRTEELPTFGDIHIFNMGLGGNGVSGFNNPYPENWGPLSQLYFIAADEYSNIKIPESMQTLQPDNINISLDLTGEEFEKHSNYIKGVLYADPKYSQNPSLNPMEEIYRLILPSTDVETNLITIAPEKNTFVPNGIYDDNGECKWSKQYGTLLRLHNFLTYLGDDASMAFGTKNGYRFSGTDYYGNIINAQSKGKCIYHYDPTDVHKTREFSLIGTIDFDNPVPPTPTEVIYIGLTTDASDWTFNYVELPSGLSNLWEWETKYGNYLKGSAYYDGASHAAEGYAISPVIDLTNVTSASVSFAHAAKFQTNIKEDCKFLIREAGHTTWDVLTIPVWPENDTWDFTNSGIIDLSLYIGKKVQFAFKYVSTDTTADTWDIKNFIVHPTAGTPETPVGPGYYYIIGSDVNGHEWELGQSDAIFTQISDNLYRWTGKQLGSGFKINDGTWDNIEVNFGSNGLPLVLGEPYYYFSNQLADNIYIDHYPVIVNPEVLLDTYNGTITVTGTPQGEYKYEWYITGLANGDDNQFDARYILAPVNGQQNIFRAENVIVDKTGDFKVCNDGYTNQYGLSDLYDEINDYNLSAQLAPQPVNINGMPFDLHGTYDITWDLDSEYITFVKVSDNTTPDQPKDAYLTVNTINGPGMKTAVAIGTSVSVQFDLDGYWSISGCTVNGESVYLPIDGNTINVLMDADKTLEVELVYDGTLEWIKDETGVAYFEGTELTIAVNEDGGVTVSGLNIGDEIVVYNLAGQIVERHFARAIQESCHPEPGIYIVRVNDCAAKLTVR